MNKHISINITVVLAFWIAAAQAVWFSNFYLTYVDSDRIYHVGELDLNKAQIKELVNLRYIGKGPQVFGAAAFDPLQKIYYSGCDSGEIDVGNLTNNDYVPKIYFGLDYGIQQVMFDTVNRRLLVTNININNPDEGTATVVSSAVNGSSFVWNKIYTVNFGCCNVYNGAYHFDSVMQIYSFINSPQIVSNAAYLYQVNINSGKEVARIQLDTNIAGYKLWEFTSLEYDPRTDSFIALAVRTSGQLTGTMVAIINSNGIIDMYKVTPLGAEQPLFMKFDPKSRSAIVFLRSFSTSLLYFMAINVDSGEIVTVSPSLPPALYAFNAVLVPNS